MISDTPKAIKVRLQEARVGRLATLDAKAYPHLIPICYVFDGDVFYTPIDAKPKRVEERQLARVRNIQANPEVALLVDRYDDDWSQLWYILVHGSAELLDNREAKQKVMGLLQEKYPNYRAGVLPRDALIIRILPRKITWWGNL